jgi:hypothetical protein
MFTHSTFNFFQILHSHWLLPNDITTNNSQTILILFLILANIVWKEEL